MYNYLCRAAHSSVLKVIVIVELQPIFTFVFHRVGKITFFLMLYVFLLGNYEKLSIWDRDHKKWKRLETDVIILLLSMSTLETFSFIC